MKNAFSRLVSYIGGKLGQNKGSGLIDFAKHDEERHGGYFNPDTMSCKLRQQNPTQANEYDAKARLAEKGDIDTARAAQSIHGTDADAARRYQQMYNTVGDDEFPRSVADLTEVDDLSGSTAPILMKDANGRLWVVKDGASAGQAEAEVEADNAYRALGIRVPPSRLIDGKRVSAFIKGKPLGEWVKTASQKDKARVFDEVCKGFAADAILGNKDVVGMEYDNILVSDDGVPYRIDNGGSLGYRAQGARDSNFGAYPDELFSMRNSAPNIDGTAAQSFEQAGALFGDMSELDISRQINSMDWDSAISKLTGDRKKIVEARVNNAKEFAVYGTNAADAGYTSDVANKIGRLAYGLMKTDFSRMAAASFKELYGSYDANVGMSMLSLSDNTAKSIRSTLEQFARAAGVDYGLLDDAYEDQGVASIPRINDIPRRAKKTCVAMKIAELVGLGVSLEEIRSGDLSRLSKDGGGVMQGLSKHLAKVAGRMNEEDLSEIMDSHLLRKAATMMFLRNSGSPLLNQDGTITLGRTETIGAIGENRVGQTVAYEKDPMASHTYLYMRNYTMGSKVKVITDVPISRCAMIDMIAGRKGNPYLGVPYANGIEYEVSANSIGCKSKVVSDENKEDRRGSVLSFKQDNRPSTQTVVPFNASVADLSLPAVDETNDDKEMTDFQDIVAALGGFGDDDDDEPYIG